MGNIQTEIQKTISEIQNQVILRHSGQSGSNQVILWH